MDAATGTRRNSGPAHALATVVYSNRSLHNIERLFEFLDGDNPSAALAAVTAIQSAIELLSPHPLLGRRVAGDIRELIVSYGETGYIALYRFVAARDEVRVLALRNQRELGYFP